MMTTVGPILGDGGWFIIDDAYLESGVPPSALHGDYLEQEATGAELTQFGDAILARRIRSPAGGSFYALALETIPTGATQLIELHPELEEAVNEYVTRQQSRFWTNGYKHPKHERGERVTLLSALNCSFGSASRWR